MQRRTGLVRWEPVTVRAAARVARLERAGQLSPAETTFYAGQLAALEGEQKARFGARLARLARRRAAHGRAGLVAGGRTPQRAVTPVAKAAESVG
jgi:hypothetical protein